MAEIIKRKIGYRYNVYTDSYEPRWPWLETLLVFVKCYKNPSSD